MRFVTVCVGGKTTVLTLTIACTSLTATDSQPYLRHDHTSIAAYFDTLVLLLLLLLLLLLSTTRDPSAEYNNNPTLKTSGITMRPVSLLSALYLFTITSALPPQRHSQDQNPSIQRFPDTSNFNPLLSIDLDKRVLEKRDLEKRDLEKRRGGGGGKGGGGSGGGGGVSVGGSRGPTTGNINGRPASSYPFNPSSNLGGRTNGGSGTPPSFGNRYAGGAAVPYTAGARSPTRLIGPALLPIAAFAFFPGIWLYSVYAYPSYSYAYGYYDGIRNRTANITCLCQQYSVCGCDPDNDNPSAIALQLTNGTGSGPPVNTTLAQTIEYTNGTIMSYINGTLENGTTATGGTDPNNIDALSNAAGRIAGTLGPWTILSVVVSILYSVTI